MSSTAGNVGRRRIAFRRSLFVGIALVPALAYAADSTHVAGGANPDSNGIEEITVVGQKHETTLQKAPVAITALTGPALEAAHVVKPADLNGQVPGLVFTESEGYNNSISIRGMGLETPQTDATQPSVSYHQDGIYIAYQVAASSDFLDVDHVEALRGPQGTVFGQNSIAGAVNVITKQPSFNDINGYAAFSYGSYNLVHPEAAINVPITDNWAIRAAGDFNLQDGYVLATQIPGTNGKPYYLETQNNWHVRLTSLFEPSDTLSITLRAEYATAHEHGAEGKSVTSPSTPYQVSDPDPNPWHESSDVPEPSDYKEGIFSATVDYQLPFATVRSLTSLQFANEFHLYNEDGLNIALEPSFHNIQWFLHANQAITQEVDVHSDPGGKLDWVVGAFFLHERLKIGYDDYAATSSDYVYPNLIFTNPDQYFAANPAIANAVFTDLYFQTNAIETRQTYSFFGQGIYHLLDDLRLTAGLRYTYDYNTADYTDYFGSQGGDVSGTLRKATWRVGVDYDLTPNNLLYGSVSTGVKPGGGNISGYYYIVDHPESGYGFLPGATYKPETVTAYEVGTKNKFLNGRATVNVSGFYYVDRNYEFQAEDIYPAGGGVASIPEVHMYGIETEESVLLPYHLRLDGNVSWEEGKIVSHYDAMDNIEANVLNFYYGSLGYPGYCPCTPNTVAANPFLAARLAAFKDIYGHPPPNLPEFTATANLSHTLNFENGTTLFSRIGLQYRDHYASAVYSDTGVYRVPSYVLWNMYFDYTLPNNRWDVSLAIDNLANAAAVSTRFTNEFGGATLQRYYPPREFIVRVAYKF